MTYFRQKKAFQVEDLRNEKEIGVWTEVTHWSSRLGTRRRAAARGWEGLEPLKCLRISGVPGN